METIDVYKQWEKRGLILKTLPGLYDSKCKFKKKSPFYENVSDLISFSENLGAFKLFFSSDIFSSGL